jgi:hypothetical protein
MEAHLQCIEGEAPVKGDDNLAVDDELCRRDPRNSETISGK